MKSDINKQSLTLPAIKKLKAFVDDHEVGILAVSGESGNVSTFPMIIQSYELDSTLWFFINRNGHMASLIKENPKVGFHIHDPKTHTSLSMEGEASFVEDRKRAYDYWDPRLRTWFPRGLDDEAVTLLKVEVTKAHLWDASEELPFGWASAAVSALKGESYHLEDEIIYESENRKVLNP